MYVTFNLITPFFRHLQYNMKLMFLAIPTIVIYNIRNKKYGKEYRENIMLTVGIKGREEVIVSEKNSAKTMGSGTLDVFATPSMIALMEQTAWKSVAPHLEEGWGTVGTLLNVTHDAPTPFGMTVWCESELVEVDGRRLVFELAAYDAKGKIGGGRHERFMIQNEKFQSKANKKAE